MENQKLKDLREQIAELNQQLLYWEKEFQPVNNMGKWYRAVREEKIKVSLSKLLKKEAKLVKDGQSS